MPTHDYALKHLEYAAVCGDDLIESDYLLPTLINTLDKLYSKLNSDIVIWENSLNGEVSKLAAIIVGGEITLLTQTKLQDHYYAPDLKESESNMLNNMVRYELVFGFEAKYLIRLLTRLEWQHYELERLNTYFDLKVHKFYLKLYQGQGIKSKGLIPKLNHTQLQELNEVKNRLNPAGKGISPFVTL